MKRVFLLLVILSFVLVPQVAEAHVLIVDKNIGAVMHIDPDDAPVAKSLSSFFFEFKDTQNTFQPKDCDCTFAILENGTTIYSQPLFANTKTPSLTNASAFFTFPREDVYQVKVVGKPNHPGQFQPFTLIYNVRVDQTADTIVTHAPTQSNYVITHWLQILLLVFICIVVILFFFLDKKYKRKNAQKGGAENNDKETYRNKY